jgi:hypothetical protein
MKTVLAIAAVAGTAAVSSAATGGFSFLAPTQVVEGQTFSVSVVATGDQANAIAGFNVAIAAANAASVGAPVGNPALFVFSTFDGVGDFEASGAANLFGKQAFASGAEIFSFQVTAGAAGTSIELSSQAGTVDAVASLAFGVDVGAFFLDTPYDTVNFGTASISVIPTPGVAGLLGLGGLVAARRRR